MAKTTEVEPLLPQIEGKTLLIDSESPNIDLRDFYDRVGVNWTKTIAEMIEEQQKLTESGVPLWVQLTLPLLPPKSDFSKLDEVPQLSINLLPKDFFSGWKDD